MLSTINLTIFVLWLASAVVDYAEFIYLWQLKEYRWDRFRDFLSTKEGKAYWSRYSIFWRSIAALVIFLWPINSVPTLKYALIIFFTTDLAVQASRVLKRHARFPVRTKKVILLLGLSLIAEGGLFLLSGDWGVLFLLIMLRFVLVSSLVRLLQIPTRRAKQYYIAKAREKLSQYPKLIVVGITGSYGKTTVKEFAAHILSGKFRVKKTPGHVNTEIGIARFILKTDFSETDVFVVEMGAYRMGEIKLICDMVRPKIGVLTGVNEQHLSLFGSQKNIWSAKYELPQSLPPDGLAIISRDSGYDEERVKALQCKVLTYGREEELHPHALLHDMKETQEGIEILGTVLGDTQKLLIPLKGYHNAINVGATALVGISLGMDFETFQKQVSTLRPSENGIQERVLGKTIILDDSYNSNPDGFRAALDMLSQYPSDKHRIVITRGMLELGEESDRVHEQLGGSIAYVADELVIISRDSEDALRRGVGTKYRTDVRTITESHPLTAYLLGLEDKEAVVLIENRLPGEVHAELMKHVTNKF